jgi:hypothetical protein
MSALPLVPDQKEARLPMHTKIMKWLSIAVLLLMGLGLPVGSYRVGLEIVVCVTALLVVTQAVRAGKYIWATGFSLVAVLFNPVVPIGLSGSASLLLAWVCLTAFLISIGAVKRQPTLSAPSITSQAPRSESL